MKLFDINSCPSCHSENIRLHTTYTIKTGEERTIHQCQDCLEYFSETKNTPQASLKTPLSTIRLVIDDLNEGKGINATARTDKISKNTIYNWMERIANLKEILLLYALCHQFLNRFVEGDELYTKVKENLPFDQSEGWTIVLMDRASRFIWELSCGEHDQTLFMDAMQILSQVIEQTQDLTLITDGERRYSNLLFEICRQTLHTCQVGRPQLILKEGVKVRFKNKGSQTHKKGPKRPKYQTQKREHPDTS